ncbi:MAG: cytochrome c [Candidatus Obscuribacterales bacterium]|nr:cytochrome c [Candidatus Obscuribacterales bacterium]
MYKGAVLLVLASLTSFFVVPSLAANKGDAKRGAKVFQAMQCAICHTDGGNNLNPERPIKGAEFLKRYPLKDNAALEKAIRAGIPNKGMPDFGKDKLSDTDMIDLVAYIRSLSESAKKGK